ncbi:MAG: 4-alpha-glucanotransferase, partial [uncultured bacterium]
MNNNVKNLKGRVLDGTFLPLFYARDDNDFGIGDINSLYKAVDLTHNLKQNIIEILPLNYSSAFESPYSVLSSRCFNTIYISISKLLEMMPHVNISKLLMSEIEQISDLKNLPKVDYESVRKIKNKFFKEFYNGFNKLQNEILLKSFKKFKELNTGWLYDHILYKILREKFIRLNPLKGWDFRSWPEDIRNRKPKIIENLIKENSEEINFEIFLQWCFWHQWNELKVYAHSNDVYFMGDIPYSVDGADVWLNPEVFNLKEPDYKRYYSQGVPPDCFSTFGQYWQFYSFDWSNPKTEDFLLKRLQWNMELYSIIRLDHVLGYYRSYLFFEDPDDTATLEKLNIWKQLSTLIEEGKKHPQKQGDITWKAYKLFLNAIKENPENFKISNLKEYFKSEKEFLLKENNMLLIAREAMNNKNEHWVKQYCVEKAVLSDKPEWDFIKISRENAYQNHEALAAFLFAENEFAPKPTDSLRPCYFKMAPGEALMKKFLNEGLANNSIIISEALGIVPEFVTESLKRIDAANYIPLIYGMTPYDKGNAYFVPNHDANAFITFGLHDSETLFTWWNKRSDFEKV